MEPLVLRPRRPLAVRLDAPALRPRSAPDRGRRSAIRSGRSSLLAHRAFTRLRAAARRRRIRDAALRLVGTRRLAGDLEEVRLGTWTRDVGLAIRTVRERVRCDDVALVGMRLGATLAALAGEAASLAALVLWDPVVDGATFLRELQVAHWKETHRRAAAAGAVRHAAHRGVGLRGRRPAARGAQRPRPARGAARPRRAGPVGRHRVRAAPPRRPRPARRAAARLEGSGGQPVAVQPLRSAVWEEDEQRVLVPHLALQDADALDGSGMLTRGRRSLRTAAPSFRSLDRGLRARPALRR